MADRIDIHGFCDEAFLPLKDAFAANFADGLEVGASLAATWRGKPVVDLWAGFADRKRVEPWREDTIVCVFSSTKIPTILCALIAIDRGLLDLDAPVARYWSEFGAHGKGEITVREAMSHRALVPGFATLQPYDLPRHWDTMVARLADEKPWFERGTLCYHANTFGHLLGELVQRASGRSFRNFFETEVARPLGVDFQIGLGDRADLSRVAKLTWDVTYVFEPGSVSERVMGMLDPAPRGEQFPLWENWDQLSIPYPGTNGVGNARSLARIGSVLAAGGTLDGRRFLSRELVDEARSEQCHAECPLIGDVRMGLGFGLDGELFPAPLPSSFHWGGYGGSWCLMDTESQTAFAYAMNRCEFKDRSADRRMETLWSAIREIHHGLG